MLTLSARDRDRLVVLREVEDGLISPASGARKLGLSRRQFRRIRRKRERDGDSAIIHHLRGRPSNHRIVESLKSRVIDRARDPVFHDFGPTLLSEHLSRDKCIGPIGSSTLRQWMIDAGLWSVSERKLRHRSRRDRRGAYGELVQMDTSIHDWLEGRCPEQPVLIATIDDATSKLYGRFAPSDSGTANRRVIVRYLECFGRMGALYVDGASHFHSHNSKRTMNDEAPMSSLIKRALESLGIELIHALSPQAKGRVERLFGTLQDRLIKEMRVERISTLEDANRFLEESFIPFWNERFTVKPLIAEDFHRPLPEGIDLMETFAETHPRLIRPDFTIRYENVYYQIPKSEAKASMPGTQITVARRLDGKLSFQWRKSTVHLTALRGLPASPPARPAQHRPPSSKPSKDHPWRTNNMRFAVKD
ncbi:MAG: ISNCY family transposase [Gemmatimonadaceae bacterium]